MSYNESMKKSLLKIIPIIFWGIFIYVVLQIPYPDNIASANASQLVYFFIPLYFALLLTSNIFLKNVLVSGSISLGLIFLLILKALDSLNFVTAILILISIYLLVSYFKKNRKVGLTLSSKIPKITSLRRRKH